MLYRSESGGCCDCGDVASWEPAGCCPLHRPSAAADGALAVALPPAASAAAQAVLALAFERLALALEALSASEVAEEAPTADAVRRLDTALREEEAAAAALVAWLQRVCAAAALRPPATAALLAGSTPPALGEPPAAQLAALERRTEAVGSAAQAALREALDVQQPAAPLRTSSPELTQRRAWPLLDRLLSARALQALSEPLLDSITTLLLLLLYERPFKEQFTHALLRHYRELVGSELAGDPAQAQRVSHCLDRVTVQLWNAPEATWRLARDHRLLDCLLGLLCDQVAPADVDDMEAEAAGPATAATAAAAAAATLALGRGADDSDEPRAAPFAFDMERPVADGRVYSRVLGDLRMVLAHPLVSLHLFARRPGLLAQLLGSLAALQGAGAEARRRGNHVEQESGTWLNAVSLEVSLLAMWAAMVEAAAETAPQPLPQPAPTPPDDSAVQALARAGAAALSAAGAWSAAHDAALEAAAGMPFSLDLHPASVHLPLHRAGALALAAVLQGAPREAGGPTAALAAVRSAAAAAPGGLCGLLRHPARVRAWSSAVRARLWVRNGSAVARLEHVYGSAFWAETGAEADALLMQLCLAAAQSPAEADALAGALFADTTLPLLVAAVEAGGSLPAEAEDDAWLQRSRDALRLAVQLCRERGALSGASPEARLRRAVVHWLALEDTTHTALCSALPAAAAASPALDAALAQVAHFVAPGGAPERAGLYTLRTAAWAEFDPAFAGYTVAEREAAMARAAQLAQPPWRPAAALRPPPALPAPFTSICLFARSPAVLRVCRACLRFAAQQPGVSAADDLCLEAMQLLALASADATAAALDGTGSGDVQLLAAALAASEGAGASILQLVTDAAAAAATGAASPVSPAVSETAAALLSDLRARGLAPPAPPAPLARTASGSTSLADAAAAAREERRRAMRDRQRAVLAAMQAQQRAFAAANDSDDDKDDDSDDERPDRRDVRMAAESESDASSADVTDDEDEDEPEEEEGGCALCRGDVAGEADADGGGDGGGGCLAWVALAQPSSVPAAASRAQPPGWRWSQLDGGRGAMSEADPRDAAPGVHVAACGHRVHAACLSRYVAALRASYTAGRHFPGEYVLSVAAGQFLCPVCRRLANGVLPSLPRAVPAATGDDDEDGDEGVDDADEADASLAACAAAPTATLGAAALSAVCASAQWAVTPRDVEPRSPPPSILPQKRSASQGEEDSLAPLRATSLGSAGRSGSMGGSRMLRRRSSAAAAAAAAASADAEADRFAERCRTLLGVPPPPRDAGPAAVLWAIVAYNVTHWETASRPLAPPAVEPAATGAERTPHWRALQAMCRMALRASGAPPPTGFSRPSFDHHRAQQQGASAGADATLPVAAASALMEWLAGGPGAEPGSMLLGALATRGDSASAAMQHMAGAEPAGADLYRLLLADADAPADRDDAPPVAMEAADGVVAVDIDSPRVGRLLATGDGFGLFCELVATATAAHNAVLIAAHGGSGSVALPPAWDAGRVRALARLAASVTVAHAAAEVGATAAGSAMQVAPVEALQAVADVACAADAAASAPLLAAVASRCAAALRRCAMLAALLLEAAPPALPSADAAEALRALRLPPLPTLLAALADGAAVGTPALSRWLAPAVPPEPRTPPTVAGGGREALRAWLAGAPAAVPAPPLRAPTLLQLPELYQDLFLELSDRPCVACRRVPDEPALCLSCGRLVCCAGACCALSHGGRRECSTHAAACGAGTAFYLLVRTTKLLLLRGSRRCLYPSPYLDAHGEEDLNLRRGRPLFLNAERYAHVRRLWATAGADADTHCLHTSRAGAEHY